MACNTMKMNRKFAPHVFFDLVTNLVSNQDKRMFNRLKYIFLSHVRPSTLLNTARNEIRNLIVWYLFSVFLH